MIDTARSRWDATLLIFVAIVAAVAALGAFFQPGRWYETLEKPAWTPPNYLFGPVWSLLYLMIAVAGWMVFRKGQHTILRVLWCLQLAVNGLWSWIFFGLHETLFALLNIGIMLLLILSFIAYAWSRQRVAAWLFVPYALWVAYATSLNAGILALN